MRMHEARQYVLDFIAKLRTSATQVSLEDCEGVAWIHQNVVFALRKLAVEIKYKFAWLFHIPWLVCEADKPDIAKQCLEELRLPNVTLPPLAAQQRDALQDSLQVFAYIIKHSKHTDLHIMYDIVLWIRMATHVQM